MDLEQLVRSIEGFTTWGPVDMIRFFAWYLHAHQAKEYFHTADINGCFDKVHVHRPSNTSTFLTQLAKQKHVLKKGAGYRLEKAQRDKLDAKYGAREETVIVDKILTELPGKLADDGCRQYLDEALICFRNQAF